MRKLAVYYVPAKPDDHWKFWSREYAEDLTLEMAKAAGLEYARHNNPPWFRMRKSYGEQDWPVFEPDSSADLHFIQAHAHMTQRPKGTVVVAVGDYRFQKTKVIGWLSEMRPDLVLCTDEMPSDLVAHCINIKARAEWMPYFVSSMPEMAEKKDITAFMSGCVGRRVYRFRSRLYREMKRLSEARSDIVVSCSEEFGKYPMGRDEYLDALSRSRYYVTAGICDTIVPPKVFEAAANGACVVCNPMRMLEPWGFIDGETCALLRNPEDLEKIIDGEHKAIGMESRLLMASRHTAFRRAREILETLKEIEGK